MFGGVGEMIMKKEDAEEFTQSLGQIVGGAVRQIELADRLGVPKALGMKLPEWVNVHLGGYAKLAQEQRVRYALEWKKKENLPNTKIADRLGVDETTVRRDLETANAERSQDSGLLKQGDSNVASAFAEPSIGAKRKAAEDERKAILQSPTDPEILPGVYAEDFFIGADRIADESVQLIFTDPPYDRDSVDLYRKAAKVAARILKPGGSFIAYSGQKNLPEVYGLINHPALRYWWTFAGVHSGEHQMLQKLGIRCGWKPIVWYVKGTRGDVSEVLSDVITGAREKTHHEWQQAEAEAAHFIEKLTSPDGLVVDFFLGSGTTKIAADKLGRRFIGFEIDRETAEQAAERVRETI